MVDKFSQNGYVKFPGVNTEKTTSGYSSSEYSNSVNKDYNNKIKAEKQKREAAKKKSRADKAKEKKKKRDAYNKQHNKDAVNAQRRRGSANDTGISSSMLQARLNPKPIFDGNGNLKIPQSTENRYTKKNHPVFSAHFYTQKGEYNASYALGREDSDLTASNFNENEFNQELMGFNINNDKQQPIPTMKINLFGFIDWEQILRPNDYVTLTVKIYDKGSGTGKMWQELTLMTGFIANIQMQDEPGKARNYSIICQGVQKILNDINLGMPNVLAQNGGILIFDINGNSNPEYETFGGGNGDNGDEVSGNTVNVPKSVKEGYEIIKDACLKYGKKYNALPSLCAASAYAETAMGTAEQSSIAAGLNTCNMWGLEIADIGNGRAGRANDTIFKSYEQGVEYYFKAITGVPNSGWGLTTSAVKGNKDFNSCVNILVNSNYMESGGQPYAARMKEAYNSLNLKEIDKKAGMV